MNTASKIIIPILFLLLASSDGLAVQAKKKTPPVNPDFTRGGKIPDGSNHDWNLGPTGLRGWIYSNKLETTEARQIYVTRVDEGSPADGYLQVGDVILGTDRTKFEFDPRTELGKAITEAEERKGRLKLIVWRAGETDSVTLKLQVMGKYGPTAPFKCRKSGKIFEQGCDALAQRMEASLNGKRAKGTNGIVNSYNAMALLSSGRKEFLPIIRQYVARAAKYSDTESKQLNSWFYGPVNMLLAEYTLATGDETFIRDMERISLEIARGQSTVGSWGHRFALPNGQIKGYGMMNAPGIPLTISMVLAKQAGVDHPEVDEAITKSARFLRFYAGKGSIPYGDHTPMLRTHEDNGKNGAAAMLFSLLGDREAAEFFSHMSLASYGGEREQGHTGNFFNILWAMPSVALNGPQASGAWLQEMDWYFDLARDWKGNFQHQGPPQELADKYKNWDTTGVFMLAYGQAVKKLQITGNGKRVVRQLGKSEVNSIIEDGRGYSFRTGLESYQQRSNQDLLQGLTSWSPVVRERSATVLAKRDGDVASELIKMLRGADTNTQLGVCQACVRLKTKAAKVMPHLGPLLRSDHFWVRIQTVEAIAGFGTRASKVVPELLNMLGYVDEKNDPRGMQQRYLCFALFDGNFLKKGLKGVDPEALYKAVRAGLVNEDGAARKSVAKIYNSLTYEEIEPLLPAIHQAILEPSPSGKMFADHVRLSGLELFAKHNIKEGIELCMWVAELEHWGRTVRISRSLKALKKYGKAARPMIPRLQKLMSSTKGKQKEACQAAIASINASSAKPKLRDLPRSNRG